MNPHAALTRELLAGDARAAARACRIVDERWPGHVELLEAIYPHAKSAWLIGITGSPGVGKSTLSSRLVQHLRASGRRVGVVAVDPTSPFTGGAILGDRIRMQAHFSDPEVFIRSLATRGAVGGLSRSAADVARVLAAWGAGVVLIETVGVGQDELDVMRVAHTTLVIQAPGAGDDLQAEKAGLMESADVFAVNKADLPGAAATEQHLRAMLALLPSASAPPTLGGGHGPRVPAQPSHGDAAGAGWSVPVVACVASRDEGIDTLLGELARHKAWLDGTSSGTARQARRLRQELTARLQQAILEATLERHRDEIERAVERICADEVDPYAASRALASQWLAKGP